MLSWFIKKETIEDLKVLAAKSARKHKYLITPFLWIVSIVFFVVMIIGLLATTTPEFTFFYVTSYIGMIFLVYWGDRYVSVWIVNKYAMFHGRILEKELMERLVKIYLKQKLTHEDAIKTAGMDLAEATTSSILKFLEREERRR